MSCFVMKTGGRRAKCHVLSWSACERRISCGLFGHEAAPRFPFPRLLPDSHISARWRGVAGPQTSPRPASRAQPRFSWRPRRSGLLSIGCGSIPGQGWVPAFAGTTKRGRKPAQQGQQARRRQAGMSCVHAVACEGEPAPDRDPGAGAGGRLLSRQHLARPHGRRPSPDLSREREKRFAAADLVLRSSVPCLLHVVSSNVFRSTPFRPSRRRFAPAAGP